MMSEVSMGKMYACKVPNEKETGILRPTRECALLVSGNRHQKKELTLKVHPYFCQKKKIRENERGKKRTTTKKSFHHSLH